MLCTKLLSLVYCAYSEHDDVIKWKHFPRYWPFVRGIHRSPVNSTHKGQWRGALMLPLICVWTNAWVNNRDAGDLRRYRVHYDVTVMGYTYAHNNILCRTITYWHLCCYFVVLWFYCWQVADSLWFHLVLSLKKLCKINRILYRLYNFLPVYLMLFYIIYASIPPIHSSISIHIHMIQQSIHGFIIHPFIYKVTH